MQGLLCWDRLRSALLPDTCLLCDLPAGPLPNLCGDCAGALPRLPRLPRQPGNRVVAFPYSAPIITLIHWMKFEANLSAALTLGTLLAEAVAESIAESGASARTPSYRCHCTGIGFARGASTRPRNWPDRYHGALGGPC